MQELREAALTGVVVPQNIVNNAFDVVAAKLQAKETKFFSWRGRVISQVDVEAHGIQLEAADKILSFAGLYDKQREASDGAPMVEVITTPDGVMRIRVGNQQRALASQSRELPQVVVGSPSPVLLSSESVKEVMPSKRPTQDTPLPGGVKRILFDEEVD